MAEIIITTDGTITGTKLTVDKKDITKKEKVVSINMYCSAPYKSRYSGEMITGSTYISYETISDNGTIERKSYGQNDIAYSTNIGQKIKNEDSVIKFIGHETDQEIIDIVDNIIAKCEKDKILCPKKEILTQRTLESLQDKAEDLGIDLENLQLPGFYDAKENNKYYAVKASETTGDQPKYPINNCKDVKDAWKLRSHGKGLKISQEQLENRIKRRAKQLGCDVPGNDKKKDD